MFIINLADQCTPLVTNKSLFIVDPSLVAMYQEIIKRLHHNNEETLPHLAKFEHDGVQVWTSSKRPTQLDHEATLALLDMRKQYNEEFASKNKINNDIWAKIARTMNEMQFFVGHGIAGRDKCRQKFSNLQTSYIKYRERRQQTGEGKIKCPPYYEELELILGDKHKTNPVLIIDSAAGDIKNCSSRNEVSTSGSSKALTSENCEASTSSSTFRGWSSDSLSSRSDEGSHRFNNINKKVKPETPRNMLLKDLTDIQKEMQQNRKDEVDRLMSFLQTQSQQRHEQLMALITGENNTNSKKRKKQRSRRSSSDSD